VFFFVFVNTNINLVWLMVVRIEIVKCIPTLVLIVCIWCVCVRRACVRARVCVCVLYYVCMYLCVYIYIYVYVCNNYVYMYVSEVCICIYAVLYLSSYYCHWPTIHKFKVLLSLRSHFLLTKLDVG
jgi:hypothetical protein